MSERTDALDTADRIYIGLRGAVLVAGATYAVFGLEPESRRIVLASLAFAVVYTAALSATALRRRATRRLLYAAAGVLDLALVVALMAATGGASSLFGRALFAWVSTLAFIFGRRAGLAASLAAIAVLGAFHAARGFAVDRWLLAAQTAGVLLHGPLIGFLADRERARTAALTAAREHVAAMSRRVLDEQSRLIQTEKLSSLGLLAAGVAHEINNPLAGVLGCVKALRAQRLEDARREEYFDTVQDGLERIRGTVRGLLDYARQTPPAPSKLDVAEVVTACARLVQPAARAKDVTIEVLPAPGEVSLRADRSQVLQAIVNVLMNAIYAARPGGRVVVAAPRDGERAGVRIVDDGPGIPREILDRVCDPFFTTKPEGEGTGLGLAVTLGVARANGGDLELASEPGRTAVTLWLPASEGAVALA